MTAKRVLTVCFALLLFLLPACTVPNTEGEPPAQSAAAENAASAADTLTARVVSAEDSGSLLLAGERGVYRNTLPDGQTYPAGTVLDIAYSGGVLESYPAQLCDIQSIVVREAEFDDRCALYMDVLNELWETDEALQADTQYVGIDLSRTSLTAAEQAALAWRFGELHQKEPLTGTYETLCEEGYIDGSKLYWKDGCLLSIEETETGENRVTFTAEKWRGGDGAYFLTDCTAARDKTGAWGDYTVGGYAIS
ncbi:MAG: hypothetical protein ACI4GO_00395 [Hominenteromicrobium sp.]